MEVVDQLKSGGKVSRGWLGVVIQEVTATWPSRSAWISHAALWCRRFRKTARRRRRDCRRPMSFWLQRQDGGKLQRPAAHGWPGEAGTSVPLQVWRKGKTQQLSVVLGELPADDKLAGKSSKAFSRGGLALTELSAEQRSALELDHGLLVEDSTGDAARAGIRVGDIILAVNNSKVATVEAFARPLRRCRPARARQFWCGVGTVRCISR